MIASIIDDSRCGMSDVAFRTAPPFGGLSCRPIFYCCSSSSATDDRVFNGVSTPALLSLIWGFGESCTIVHGITSEPENVSSNVLCSIFVDLKPFGCNFKGSLFDPQFEGLGACGVRDGPIR